MRFVPPPTTTSEPTSAPLSFATLVLPAARRPATPQTPQLPSTTQGSILHPLQAFHPTHAAAVQKPNEEYDECVEIDQYTIDASANRDEPREGCERFWKLVWAVIVSNPVDENVPESQRRKRSRFLGPTGHLERFSARTHLVGAVVFAIYAIYRPYR